MRVLLVEDDPIAQRLIAEDLRSQRHECRLASDGLEALDLLRGQDDAFDLVLSDLVMPRMDGLALLQEIKKDDPTLPVILMTGVEKSAEAAIRAEELGADDYLLKPLKQGEVLFAVDRAAKQRDLRRQVEVLDQAVQERFGFDNLVGRNHRMRQIYDAIEILARTDATVLITGETGTGKELVARAIHYNSPRRDQRFLTISCGALPETLLESELFGHERGAFTGANVQKIGKFEFGDGGTIFLDEVGEIPMPIQVKILRVLQDREFERLGGNRTIRVDLRIIAATHVDLPQAIEAGRFREDLYYRLNVVPLHMPPLRERKEDVPLLVRHVLTRLRERLKTDVKRVARPVLSALMRYDWPGNVRELENLIERAVIMARGPVIRSVEIPDAGRATIPNGVMPGGMVPGKTLPEAVAACERAFIEGILRREGGHIGRSAAACGITERTLHRKMKRYGLNKSRYQRSDNKV
jgi:DNA-binding NtrC family response regulator